MPQYPGDAYIASVSHSQPLSALTFVSYATLEIFAEKHSCAAHSSARGNFLVGLDPHVSWTAALGKNAHASLKVPGGDFRLRRPFVVQ